jgi:type III secretory pathway lipoprotein EscJ
MNRNTIVMLVMLAFSPFINAAEINSAAGCLGNEDAIPCLVTHAQKRIAQAPDDKGRTEAIAKLLVAISYAGYRDDDFYQLAVQTDSSANSPFVNWQLLFAQQNYAVRILGKLISEEETIRASSLASVAKRLSGALDVISLITTTCDAQYGLNPNQMASWNGLPREYCEVSLSDAASIDADYPGLSVFASTVLHSYHGECSKFISNLQHSYYLIDSYAAYQKKKGSTKYDRDTYLLQEFVGTAYIALGQALIGNYEHVRFRLERTDHIAKYLPGKLKGTALYRSALVHLAWAVTISGSSDKAYSSIRDLLKRTDTFSDITPADYVDLVSTAIKMLATIRDANKTKPRTLYAGLDSDDVSQAVSDMASLGMNVEIMDDQVIVLADRSLIDTLRMKLAMHQFPKRSLIQYGISLPCLGEVSDFRKLIAYRIRLESEIVKPIKTLDGVIDVRVHLAIPKDSTKPSASVWVKLAEKQKLSIDQIRGIMHLVSKSVPNLNTNHISVIDQDGVLLTKDIN